jgi:hypothetical protein
MAGTSGQFVTPVPSVMPAWLVPYPGATAQTRQMGNTAESSFSVPEAVHEVLSHYRALFASAGVPFQPGPMGGGFFILTPLPECDLTISIRRLEPNTTVKVTCSPRLASTQQIINQQAQARAEQAASDRMKEFDTPVYPQPKAPTGPLMWPVWLVCVDGSKLRVERFPGILKSSFTSQPPREAVQSFYADLFNSHNYRVTQGLAAVPEKFGSWVMGTTDQNGESGRRAVVRVKIRPVGQDFAVELSLQ